MPEKTSRRTFLAAAGTGTIAALAGCGGDDGDSGDSGGTTDPGGQDTTEPGGEDTTTAPATGGTLQMASNGPVQSLDPINAKGSGAGYPQYNLQLFQFPNGAFPPEGMVVEGYDLSDDGLTYTFNLMEGVKFHDGEELTAHDVVYSWERLAGSSNSRNRDDIIGETMTVAHTREVGDGETQRVEDGSGLPEDTQTTDYVAGSLGVRAVDDYTVELELATAFRWTLYQIAGGAFAIIPENSVGDIERDDIDTDGEYEYNEFFGTEGEGPAYVGLGPFAIDEWSKGDELALTAHEDYHLEGPYLDGVTYTIIPSGNTRLQRFKSGNLDILESMPTASYNNDAVSIDSREGNKEVGTYEFDNGDTVNFGRIPVLTTEYLLFNCQRVIRPARVALAYLLNQDRVARDAYKNVAKAAYHITPPAVYPTWDDVPNAEAYDKHAADGWQSNTDFGADGYPYGYGESLFDEAAQVMEDAGYGPDNMYSLTATNIAGDDAYGNVLTTLQEKGRQAHIDMTITEADFGTIISQAINGEMDMFALGDGMEYPSASNFLRFLWGNVSPFQFTRWGGPDDRDGGPSNYVEEYWNTAKEAWNENYRGHTGGGEENQTSRYEAYQTIEEMNWASVQELPTVHAIDQRWWQQNIDVEMFGVMENQKFDTVRKS